VPPFAQVLEIAERTRPAGALSVLRPYAPLCVSVDPSREEARGADGRPDLAAWAGAHPGMSALESIDGRRFFLQEAAPRGEPLSGDPLPIARIGSWRGAVDTALLTDGDRVTAWRSRQISGAHLIIALECRADLTGLRLSQGAHLLGFPRRLAIQVARRRGPWRTVWQGATLERLAAGAIEDARLVPIEIPVAAEHVNRVRVRLLQPSRIPWAVAEVAVFGRCRGGGPE
jgi:hypothetical protein